jgi:N utilization substance protein B
MGSRRDAREWAVQLLFQLDFNPGDVEVAFNAFWAERETKPAAREFVEELVRGVTAQRPEIDGVIQKTAENWHLSRMAGVDRNIIRLAIYEMLYRKEIPAAVSINEAVEIAKTMGDVGSPRFVNGILDKVMRELKIEVTPKPAKGKKPL